MPFEHLPGIWDVRIDGRLAVTPVNENPIVCIIGTAGQGEGNALYTVNRTADAASAFARDGTLTRGMFELASAAALNIRLLRVGATSSVLATVGGGIRIETVRRDASAGVDYTLFWDDTADRLRVFRASDSVVVYDNNPTTPVDAIDLGEVVVTGTASGSPGNIGTLAAPVTLAAANGVSGAVYTAGTDGLNPSRMRLFENLYDAYQLLENQELDIIVPMDAYLDDENVQDMTTAEVVALGLSTLTTYPAAGSPTDVLGEVFVQEFEGRNYYWWDTDRDGVAEIFPTVGSSGAAIDAFGNALVAADFHEANFGYQLARFCFDQSQDQSEMIGVIGVRPPASYALASVSDWIGRLPTTALNANNIRVITVNGTGLLGNKWMVGRLANAGTGLPGHIINGIDGRFGGGLIATDTIWPDGTQQTDRNAALVDLGKYISVFAGYAVLANPWQAAAYVASGAPSYGGFVSSLPSNSAPTNKVVRGVRLPFRIRAGRLDTLAGRGYVLYHDKPKGIVIADAPTAARVESDYRRLTTVRIVKDVIDAIRAAADPFLGEPISGARLAALETAIEQALSKMTKGGFLQRYEFTLVSTPSQQVQGRATVELKLVPAFELRQITVNVSLSAA